MTELIGQIDPPPAIPLVPIDIEAELDALARRYRAAGGLGIQVLNLVGGQAEGLLERLPHPVRDNLDGATERALRVSIRLADASDGVIGNRPGWMTRALTTGLGAAGGLGGLPSALAELPVTTTVLLRVIMNTAGRHGFDPRAENVQFDCLRVFATAGPLEHDDGSDLAFITARLTLTGATLQGLITRIAPRLATAMGQKLAAQTVPVLGAVAGAATNYAYTSYYEEMAHVHFRLRRLSIETGLTEAQLRQRLRAKLRPRSLRL